MSRNAYLAGAAGLVIAATGLAGLGEAVAQGKTQKAPAAVTVINKRGAALTELEIGADGKVVGTLAAALAAGKTTTVKLKGGTGCVFTIKGSYDDDTTTESENVNLCKDTTIRLTD